MPKEIDESKLNYNKYPGEHVVEYEGVVTIGGNKTFHVVRNYKEAFSAEKLEQRFSDLFDKYDYIVGDWGFEQLRLKGFFSTSRKKMSNDNKINHLEDYINEYCNYGCPYFVLRRVRTGSGPAREEAFISERIFEEKEGRPVLERSNKKKQRNRKRGKLEKKLEKSFDIQEKTDLNKRKKNFSNKDKKEKLDKRENFEKEPKQKARKKNSFVIRTRND